MKRGVGGDVPCVMQGGPFDGTVLRTPELLPEIKFPIQPDFMALTVEKQRPAWDQPIKQEVAVYRRLGTETSLQLPPPAPPEARRKGYLYGYDRTETM